MVNCMRKYINECIKETNKKLKGDITSNDINDLLIKIKFFQHERLIHLIVTLFCILLFIIFIVLMFYTKLFFIPTVIAMVLIIFYIVHYFFLENSVQYLYKLYDDMYAKIK